MGKEGIISLSHDYLTPSRDSERVICKYKQLSCLSMWCLSFSFASIPMFGYRDRILIFPFLT